MKLPITSLVRKTLENAIDDGITPILFPKQLVIPLILSNAEQLEKTRDKSGNYKPEWAQKLTTQPPQGVLLITFVRASNLPKMDFQIRGNGKADPFIVAHVGAEVVTTGVREQTLNPVWNETHELLVYCADVQRLKIQVFDWDDEGFSFTRGEFIGICEVPMARIVGWGERYTASEWSEALRGGPSSGTGARITIRAEYRRFTNGLPMMVVETKKDEKVHRPSAWSSALGLRSRERQAAASRRIRSRVSAAEAAADEATDDCSSVASDPEENGIAWDASDPRKHHSVHIPRDVYPDRCSRWSTVYEAPTTSGEVLQHTLGRQISSALVNGIRAVPNRVHQVGVTRKAKVKPNEPQGLSDVYNGKVFVELISLDEVSRDDRPSQDSAFRRATPREIKKLDKHRRIPKEGKAKITITVGRGDESHSSVYQIPKSVDTERTIMFNAVAGALTSTIVLPIANRENDRLTIRMNTEEKRPGNKVDKSKEVRYDVSIVEIDRMIRRSEAGAVQEIQLDVHRESLIDSHALVEPETNIILKVIFSIKFAAGYGYSNASSSWTKRLNLDREAVSHMVRFSMSCVFV